MAALEGEDGTELDLFFAQRVFEIFKAMRVALATRLLFVCLFLN